MTPLTSHKPLRNGLNAEQAKFQYLEAVKITITFHFNWQASSKSPQKPEVPYLEWNCLWSSDQLLSSSSTRIVLFNQKTLWCWRDFSPLFPSLKHHYFYRYFFGTHQHDIFLHIVEISFNLKRDLRCPVIYPDIWTSLMPDHIHFTLKMPTDLSQ